LCECSPKTTVVNSAGELPPECHSKCCLRLIRSDSPGTEKWKSGKFEVNSPNGDTKVIKIGHGIAYHGLAAISSGLMKIDNE